MLITMVQGEACKAFKAGTVVLQLAVLVAVDYDGGALTERVQTYIGKNTCAAAGALWALRPLPVGLGAGTGMDGGAARAASSSFLRFV